MKVLFLLAGIAIVLACTEQEPVRIAPGSITTRTIADGQVVGYVANNGAHVWRGLPYAASTAGLNRWRAPQPVQPWQGVRESVDIAPRCAQLTNEYDEDEGLTPGQIVGSEDCLTLDIYAPSDTATKALPVLFWIHGGGNVWGRSSTYDGSQLAQNENIIVVAVQYRVGPFGWFSLPALRDTAKTANDGAAAFAILDLIAGLKWIRENIAAFGGAPDKITIAGESAGGHNVAALLASGQANGLFHRAIIQSGSFDSITVDQAEGTSGNRLNTSNEIVGKLGAATASELRAISAETLLSVYVRGRGFIDVPRMIQDGVVLPAGPLRAAFESMRTFNAVPIITGTTRDEMKLFYFGDDRVTKPSLWFLVTARNQDHYDALTETLSRLWRVRSVDEPSQAMIAAGHRAVYSYRFDWDDGGRFLTMDFKKLLGAAHGFELPFLFQRFEHLGDADRLLFTAGTLDDRERLSQSMGSYWAAFVRDGMPSDQTGAQWPDYGKNGGSVLRLDTENDGGIEVIKLTDSVDAIAQDLIKDTRIDNTGRCFIVQETAKWLFTIPLQAQLRAATGCQ